MSGTGLLDASSVRELAARLDLRPTKQRGQNFVIDANTVRRIVNLAELSGDDVALEIGPGLGSLTLGLLEVARHVTAVEIDDRLATQLPDTVAARLPEASVKASTFEVGIRNAGLGLLLVFSFFGGLGGMALVAAWWGIWDIIAGLAVAAVWKRRTGVSARSDAAVAEVP